MPKVIRFHQAGGPEVMKWEEVVVGEPGTGEARVRHTAVGVNFIDTYHRSGLYPLPLPSGLGSEAAGVVEAVGPGVTHVRPGDRVAYAGGPPGSYADVRLVPADRLVKLPDDMPARPRGELRQRVRPGAAVRTGRPGAERLALRDPADARHVHGDPGRPGGDGGGLVRGRSVRPGEGRDRPDVPTPGRATGAPRFGG